MKENTKTIRKLKKKKDTGISYCKIGVSIEGVEDPNNPGQIIEYCFLDDEELKLKVGTEALELYHFLKEYFEGKKQKVPFIV